MAVNVVEYDKILKILEENGELGKTSLISCFATIKKILMRIPADPNDITDPTDPNFIPLFFTVGLDTGQFERNISNVQNSDYDIRYPAAFIRFINVRYLVDQNRTNEGRAQMRIRYILNTLNNQDDTKEIECFQVFERVNNAIQDAKATEVALQERCNLMYWDMPTSADMLQPYWIDYELFFREDSSYQYRDWIKKYIVHPPFTNFDDIPKLGKPNVDGPSYDEVSKFFLGTTDQWNPDDEWLKPPF